jgi:tetratricopeptide (TPR) repeat protein
MTRAALFAALAGIVLVAPPLVVESPASGQALAGQARPEPQSVEASGAVLHAVDSSRLLRDRDYALEILRHLDIVEAAPGTDWNPYWLRMVRAVALATLGRTEEVRALVDRALAGNPTDPRAYWLAFRAAMAIEDVERAVSVIEQASRNVPEALWPDLRRSLTRVGPVTLVGQLQQREDTARQVRLAEALLRIGWPSPDDRDNIEGLHTILLDDRLARDDRAGAAALVAQITTPGRLLRLLMLRRYDAVLGADADRIGMLRTALAAYDRETERAVAVPAPSLPKIRERAALLRALGRGEEALALLLPYTRDIPATVASDEVGMWAIYDAAHTLLDLDRDDQAIALMNRLVSLPLADFPGLIGPAINLIAMLEQAGLDEDALTYARALEPDAAQHANAYGRMWIAQGVVCALARLGRAEQAAARLAEMRPSGTDNQVALTRAYLCVGDMEAAEALLVERLGAADPEQVLLELQIFALSRSETRPDSEDARWALLRERPAVRQAVERVGRVLRLPLARVPWAA